MNWILNEKIEEKKFELLIDINVFSKDIILKSAYAFLNKWYFFFKQDDNSNIVLQFNSKKSINSDIIKKIIDDFLDELLFVSIRKNIEKNNKVSREKIILSAIDTSLEWEKFVEYNYENDWVRQDQNQIDFDKDIDDILKEIENDPELKIDEEEIDKILKEIEEETETEIQK